VSVVPAQALYRKWRPQLWEEVVGQDHIVQTLRNALRSDRMTHAYLFAGPRGCGKTTTARLVAKALNCLNPDPTQRPDNTCARCVAVNEGRFLDLIEIDGASNNGVENIRELRDKINFAPSEGRFKIYIIDEVHMLSLGAFNALLKTLEEPPAHAVFILATTESYKIPATVSSRCQRFEFRRIPVVEIVARLKALCAQEGLSVEEAALELVARQATGSLRDAISLLDQLVASDAAVTLLQAQALLGTAAGQALQQLVDALAAGDATAALNLVNAAVDAGADPRQLARQMMDYLRGLMLVRLGNAALVEVIAETRAVMARQAERWDTPRLLRALRAFNAAANDARGGWQPQLPLELAIVECAAPIPASTPPAPSEAFAISAPAAAEPRGRRASRPSSMAAPKSPSAPEPDPPADTAPDLTTAWGQFIRLLLERNKIQKMTATELEQCRIEGLDGNILRVSTQSKVFLEKFAARPDMYQVMGSVLSEVLGFPCVVKFLLASGRGSRSKDMDVPPGGMVATALRDLGGEIVE
jgi:DNA polymerase-3 subunit gamma/tau